MPSDSPSVPQPNGEAKPQPGLPTVTPPTGGMFLRLFGVPALIVGGVVLLLILLQPLIGRYLGGSISAEQALRELDNPNKEVRWRAAEKLVQVLPRDNALASDSAFALQLVQRLRKTLEASAPFEKTHAEQRGKLNADDEARELAKLEPERNYINLLSQCLGHFLVPAGTLVLREMAEQDTGMDPTALDARRIRALWALANLGQTVKQFDQKLSAEQQESVRAKLEALIESGERSKDAKSTLEYLQNRKNGRLTTLGVDRTVEKCAAADNPLLRESAAYVVNFWPGTSEEEARMENVLNRLSYDSGKGQEELAKLEEQNPENKNQTRKVVKKPGFGVQANATIALARMGSTKTHLALLQTMLDEKELRSIFVVQSTRDGSERPDEALVIETVVNALKAADELHRKNSKLDLSRLQASIDQLTQDPNPSIRSEASKCRIKD